MPSLGWILEDDWERFLDAQPHPPYRRAVTIVVTEELGGTMMKKLTELFDKDMDAAWARVASERGRVGGVATHAQFFRAIRGTDRGVAPND
jgi:hypothetical protein